MLELRIPGVLQRIGGAYAIAALLGFSATPRRQAGLIAAILIGYWLTLRLYPLAPPPDTLTARIDRFFMTGHLASASWDRMGILPTFPAAATVLLGMLCGRWLEAPIALRVRIRGLAAAGAVAIVAGLLWGLVFPINQSMWTSSYVLFTGERRRSRSRPASGSWTRSDGTGGVLPPSSSAPTPSSPTWERR